MDQNTSDLETIGVVVPMYNSAATITATLDSITRQTYRDIAIVVVDDGSSDHGPAIVQDKARADHRIRLLTQPNAGVAAARNHGAASLDTAFLAFCDADDLWAPEKLELQMRCLREGGADVGLAYAWFAVVDENDRIAKIDPQFEHKGAVLEDLCGWNFIGNGSSVLVRRSVFEATGGFDPSLREIKAQGCEDLLFYLLAAEQTQFCVVPRYLVGYRFTPENMSSDVWQMRRSGEAVLAGIRKRHPQYGALCQKHLDVITGWLVTRAIHARRYRTALELYRRLSPTAIQVRAERWVYLRLALVSLVPHRLKSMRRRLFRKRYTEVAW